MESHLLQMRGLKQKHAEPINSCILSHLLQMRGLKLPDQHVRLECTKSHLLQMRGLKRRSSVLLRPAFRVASFTDAWIETLYLPYHVWSLLGRIFYRCVD